MVILVRAAVLYRRDGAFVTEQAFLLKRNFYNYALDFSYTFSNLIRCHLEIFLNAYTCVRYHLRCTEQPTNLIEANKTIVLPSRCLTPFWFVAALGRLIYDRLNNEKSTQGLQSEHVSVQKIPRPGRILDICANELYSIQEDQRLRC